MVYLYYLQKDNGYVFDYESGKLRTSNNEPIDLALMYTCRIIGGEMRGRALEINQVTFRIVYSESVRLRAGRFHILL